MTVNISLLSANAAFLVKVDKGLSWSLSCYGARVDISQCHVLSDVPAKLSSVRIVLDLLSTLQEVAVCQGNSVDDFRQLVDARGTTFMDSSGKKRRY